MKKNLWWADVWMLLNVGGWMWPIDIFAQHNKYIYIYLDGHINRSIDDDHKQISRKWWPRKRIENKKNSWHTLREQWTIALFQILLFIQFYFFFSQSNMNNSILVRVQFHFFVCVWFFCCWIKFGLKKIKRKHIDFMIYLCIHVTSISIWMHRRFGHDDS